MTNVASTFCQSGPGYIGGYLSYTASATAFNAVELQSGGRGAQCDPIECLTAYRLFEGIISPVDDLTIFDSDTFPWPDPPGEREPGQQTDTGGALAIQTLVSASWRDAFWQNPDTTAPAAGAVDNPLSLSLSSTFSPAVVRGVGAHPALTGTFTVAAQRRVGRTLTLGATLSPVAQRTTGRTLALGTTLTVAAKRTTGKLLSLGTTLTPAVIAQKVFLVVLNLAATFTVVAKRGVGKALPLAGTFTVTAKRGTAKGLGLTATLTVATIKAIARTLGLSTTFTPAVIAQGPAIQVSGNLEGGGARSGVESGGAVAGRTEGGGVGSGVEPVGGVASKLEG